MIFWLFVASLICSVACQAQTYPAKPVKIVVSYPAGGSPDLVARVLGQNLGDQLGQPFVVENIPGAASVAAVRSVLNAPADGYTLLLGDASIWAVGPAMRARNLYDFQRDFIPIRQTHTTSLLLAVGPTLPVKDFREFLALVRSKPGFFAYGSAGNGSNQHLAMEAIKTAYGLDILHVPFKSSTAAMPALLAGDVQMMITAFSTVAPFTKTSDGRLRVLAVTTMRRSRLAPDVPSVSEFGVADFDFASGGAILVRSGTPRGIVERIAEALDKAFASPEVTGRLKSLQIEYAEQSSLKDVADYVRKDITQITALVKKANLAGTE